ncbi:MAG TPA: magnesium chelatase subunit D [Steroidobacteraceae bacterium]|nr:magnesium chelatase subunit D [Steroidobacteraceae bacterium]
MNSAAPEGGPLGWPDACIAAAILAVDPVGVGGVRLRGPHGPARTSWLDLARKLAAPVPVRVVPRHVSDSRLLGGLDLGATLALGVPTFEQGLLAGAEDHIICLTMAERWSAAAIARITHVLDSREVVIEREGFSARAAAHLGVIALDEGVNEESPPHALLDRLAMHLDLEPLAPVDPVELSGLSIEQVGAARELLPAVLLQDAALEVLAQAAHSLGIESLRALGHAVRVTCVSAALRGRRAPEEQDLRLAARLVLALRAKSLPASEPVPPASERVPPEAEGTESSAPRTDQAQPHATQSGSGSDRAGPRDTPDRQDADRPDARGTLPDRVVAAAQAAIPKAVLCDLQLRAAQPVSGLGGRRGAEQSGGCRGRALGCAPGKPRSGATLDLSATLVAAAPWQHERRRRAPARAVDSPNDVAIRVRQRDFRVRRYKNKSRSTTLFVVDASGSQALHRLAEAKGAVELLLAECYVRRDRVGLIAFRGEGAELLLSPTRSLLRARRCLASLPGGGGTPLSRGIEAATQLAESVRRSGDTPQVVVMTDGRANVSHSGRHDRNAAREDALSAARRCRATGIGCVLVDTGPRPSQEAQTLAQTLGGRYVPLPHADAHSLARIVRPVAKSTAEVVRSQR